MPTLPIILYEGVEDKAFLEALLKDLGISHKFLFHSECGGKSRFEKLLRGLVPVDHQAIIIVADNDGEPPAAFAHVQAQIGNADYTVPQRPREIVETQNQSPLSVLMIPWDNDAGCLETLCLSAPNAAYKRQLECADELVRCADAEGWGVSKIAKLRMRAFLSAVCKSDPNTGLRYAWSTDGGRPGNIFPLNDVAAYKQIAEYFKSFAG